jgi:hypothetical protein
MSIDQFLLSADTTDLDYPEVRPTLDLNFARVKALDPRITFTRASGGSYTGADGLIKYAGVNEPRFDHDPTTGESLGLLIEESRTNLVVRSNDFSTWIFEGSGLRTQNLVGPDGVSNSAWRIADNDTAADFIRFYTSISITPSSTTNYCLSCFINSLSQSLELDLYAFFVGSSVKGSLIRYNTVTDTITPLVGDGNGILPTTFGRVFYPNGWIRLYFVVNDANSGLNNALQFRIYPNGRDGNDVGSMGIFGAQVEVGSFPTSYIPTEGSSRTRAADNASMTGTNFSSWYRQDEGTIYGSAKTFQGLNSYIAGIWGGSVQNRIALNWDSLSRFFSGSRYLNVFSGTSTSAGTAPIDTFGKIAFAYQLYNNASSWNGGQVLKSFPLGFPNFTRLDIGNNNNSAGNYLNGTIRRLTYYPKRLPDAQLQALTK